MPLSVKTRQKLKAILGAGGAELADAVDGATCDHPECPDTKEHSDPAREVVQHGSGAKTGKSTRKRSE